MPLTVRVGDLQFDTVVQDLSAGGICSRLPSELTPGQALQLAVEFSRIGSQPKLAAKMTANGIVMRVRDFGDGTREFAARFISHRFLDAAAQPSDFGTHKQ